MALIKNRSTRLFAFAMIALLATFVAGFWLKPIVSKTAGVSSLVSCLAGPKFDDYPVALADVYARYPAPVDFTGQTEAYSYRSFIRTAVARGVNYGGHYVVAEWGCGTNCQNHAIVDAKTGKIVLSGLKSNYGLDYHKDSILLVVDPRANSNNQTNTRYFVAQGGAIKPLCEK